MKKWIDGDEELRKDKKRITVEIGRISIESTERIVVYVYLPEPVDIQKMNLLQERIKIDCEEIYNLKEILLQ